MSTYFHIIIYYGGYFQENPTKEYINGKVKEMHAVDSDFIAYFDLVDWLEKLGYVEGDNIYYLSPHKGLNDGLVQIKSDVEVMEMIEGHRRMELDILSIYTVAVTKPSTDQETEITVDDEVHSEADVGSDPDVVVDLGNEEEVSTDFESDTEESTDLGDPSNRETQFRFTDESDNDEDLFEVVHKQDREQEQPRSDKSHVQLPPLIAEGDYMVTDSTDSDELHSPPNSEDEGIKRQGFEEFMPDRDMQKPEFKVGMLFGSHKVFKDALKEYAILEGRDIYLKKSEKDRVTAACRSECGWRIHASKVADEETFQIKTMQPIHNCGRSYVNRQASAKWIGMKYIENFCDDATWKVNAFINNVRRDYKVDISRTKAYRARRTALKQVQGDYASQYAQLWNYCETLREYNLYSFVKMKIDTPRPGMNPRFERLFVMLSAQREGFVTACRPFIGLDGCFLKGPFGGQLLSAIGRDANDNFYPLCLAVVEAETKASWSWFLENMLAGLGNLQGYTFISDRQKGLLEAFQSVIPGVDNRFCVRHLYANFRDAGFRGKALKDELWGAATACTKPEFDEMNALKALSPAAFDYLSGLNPSCWSRHAFSPVSKCDLVVNNLTESFNSYILNAREKPIITMVEEIRTMLMLRYHKKRQGIMKLTQSIPPKIQQKLERSKMAASSCRAVCAGNGLFQVSCDMRSYVVNLNRRTCGCRKWDLCGIPCNHAVAAIYEDLRQPEEYINEFYTKTMYLKSYDPIIYPVPSQEQWVQTNYPPIEPPMPRKAPGRPKKSRKRGSDEPRQGSGIRLRHESLRCSNCLRYGHNLRTCSLPLNPNRKIKKRRNKDGQSQQAGGCSSNQVGEASGNHSVPQHAPSFIQNEFGIGVSYEQVGTEQVASSNKVMRNKGKRLAGRISHTRGLKKSQVRGNASGDVATSHDIPTQTSVNMISSVTKEVQPTVQSLRRSPRKKLCVRKGPKDNNQITTNMPLRRSPRNKVGSSTTSPQSTAATGGGVASRKPKWRL